MEGGQRSGSQALMVEPLGGTPTLRHFAGWRRELQPAKLGMQVMPERGNRARAR